jgi:hypothetical protein
MVLVRNQYHQTALAEVVRGIHAQVLISAPAVVMMVGVARLRLLVGLVRLCLM